MNNAYIFEHLSVVFGDTSVHWHGCTNYLNAEMLFVLIGSPADSLELTKCPQSLGSSLQISSRSMH